MNLGRKKHAVLPESMEEFTLDSMNNRGEAPMRGPAAVIVWDSREAEERNAREKLIECKAELTAARVRVHMTTIAGAVCGVGVVGSLWNLAYHQSVLMVVLAAPGLLAGLAGLVLWPRSRRAARSVLPDHEARLRCAQENHDRVCGPTTG
jgi:hypothetical protein